MATAASLAAAGGGTGGVLTSGGCQRCRPAAAGGREGWGEWWPCGPRRCGGRRCRLAVATGGAGRGGRWSWWSLPALLSGGGWWRQWQVDGTPLAHRLWLFDSGFWSGRGTPTRLGLPTMSQPSGLARPYPPISPRPMDSSSGDDPEVLRDIRLSALSTSGAGATVAMPPGGPARGDTGGGGGCSCFCGGCGEGSHGVQRIVCHPPCVHGTTNAVAAQVGEPAEPTPPPPLLAAKPASSFGWLAALCGAPLPPAVEPYGPLVPLEDNHVNPTTP